jgi:RNA polymerase sigma-70 factor (ECF subfamily)
MLAVPRNRWRLTTVSPGRSAFEREALERQQRFENEALPHLRSLYGTAYRMTGNREDAEDLVQETFLRAYRGFDRFVPGSDIRAWLFTILHRARTDAFRRRSRSPKTVEMADGTDPGVPPQQHALSATTDLTSALSRLPDAFRSAVVLRDVEDFSYDEIARILGIPIGTVMSRIHRGRALLRQTLAGTGEPR